MTCDEYFEDPEKNAAHLESCAACRAMTEELDAPIEVEHDWNCFGLGGWAPQQCQVDR